MEQKAKGAGFLKVTGILMIIGGALGIIFSIIALMGVALLAALSEEFNAGLYYFSCIVALISAVLQLVAGIIGVANANKPEKAMSCIVWGGIVAVLSVVGNILGVVAGGQFSIPSLAIGLVLPVLFIIGGVKNRQAQ